MKKEEGSFPLILYPIAIAFIILYIVFTILTFGIFLPDEDEKANIKKPNQKGSEEERLQVSLQRKSNRLKSISARIHELNKIKQQITKREKRILFAVRLIVASCLVLINVWYLSNTENLSNSGKLPNTENLLNIDEPPNPEIAINDYISTIANLNGCILMLYSLPAYILYGTIGKFTTAMKNKTTAILRKKHIPSLSELQMLKDEEVKLKKDIDYLKMQLQTHGMLA